MQLSAVLLTIGLPAIDESLDKLLVAMETFPNVAVLGDDEVAKGVVKLRDMENSTEEEVARGEIVARLLGEKK